MPDNVTDKFHQIFKQVIILILDTLFQKLERWNISKFTDANIRQALQQKDSLVSLWTLQSIYEKKK
jgi:hypothetical protein